MPTHVLRLGILSVAFCSIGCGGGTGGEDGPADADADADDAGSSEVARDAGRDVRPDTPTDTAPTPLTGTWLPFPDPACANEVAEDPASSIPAFRWSPCASGPAACEELVADWTTAGAAPVQLNGIERVRLVKGTPLLGYTRRYPSKTGMDVEVVQALEGPAVFAVRGDRTSDCQFNSAFGEWGISLVPRVVATPLAKGKDVLVLTKPWDGALEANHIAYDLLGSPKYIEHAAVSARGVFLERETPSGSYLLPAIQYFDPVTKGVSPSASKAPNLLFPTAFGEGAFTSGAGIDWLVSDGMWSALVTEAPSHGIIYHAVDRASSLVVWTDGVAPPAGGAFADYVLWASPIAMAAADMKPRPIAKLPADVDGRVMVANAGVVLNPSGDDGVLLTRVSDGAGWTLAIGRGPVVPVWVDDAHIWVMLADDDVVDRATGTLIRIPRSSLGAPNTPSGF